MAKSLAKRIFLLLSLLVPWAKEAAVAETKIDSSFSPDPNIQKIAEAYALDAVDVAKEQFGIELDWSDESIVQVEKALAGMRASYLSTKPKPTDEQVYAYAKGYGSYIGEVFRRNHGARWGIVTLGSQKMPGLQTESGASFWPWAKAFNRITKGDEDNVAWYYQVLLKSEKQEKKVD